MTTSQRSRPQKHVLGMVKLIITAGALMLVSLGSFALESAPQPSPVSIEVFAQLAEQVETTAQEAWTELSQMVAPATCSPAPDSQ